MAHADHSEVAGQWRPLSPVEQTRATALLEMAEILIRRNVPADQVASTEGQKIAKQVSVEMVIDALTPGIHRGKSSYAMTVGGIADSATLLNPAATIVFSEAQRALFGIATRAEPRWYFGDGEV
ncbi:hypothetical protein [Rhodococcus sp. UNC363MFTsu5.1]|uniref:hypothetical protein n=1 Tax=Rhodococcus sp. UNC363MFTsu5.1 TaxID=1449069 RepID=UPI0004899615|nr:hypothetical protein [Rhodococcus sp. UNC363MFTsu5.1]